MPKTELRLTKKEREELLLTFRVAAQKRAEEWDLLRDIEDVIGDRTGLDELIDGYAHNIERPAEEAGPFLEKLIPDSVLDEILALKEDK